MVTYLPRPRVLLAPSSELADICVVPCETYSYMLAHLLLAKRWAQADSDGLSWLIARWTTRPCGRCGKEIENWTLIRRRPLCPACLEDFIKTVMVARQAEQSASPSTLA